MLCKDKPLREGRGGEGREGGREGGGEGESECMYMTCTYVLVVSINHTFLQSVCTVLQSVQLCSLIVSIHSLPVCELCAESSWDRVIVSVRQCFCLLRTHQTGHVKCGTSTCQQLKSIRFQETCLVHV